MLSSSDKPSQPPPAPNVYELKCRGIMADYAQKHHVDPIAYIAQNKDFLAKCTGYYANQGKTH